MGWQALAVPSSQPGVTSSADPRAAAGKRQFLIGAASLVGLYLVVFGTAVVNSVRVVVDPAALHDLTAAASSWTDRVAVVEGEIFSVIVVVVVVLKWLPKHAPDVARRMGLGRQSVRFVPGGTVGAAAAYVGIAMASGWLGDHLVAGLHLSRGSYPEMAGGVGGVLMGTAASLSAGTTEEIVLVALAVAVVDHRHAMAGRRLRWADPTLIGLLLTLRWLVHLYYGWGSLFVLFWVVGVYVLYRWVGSVWPLVLGHAAYDCVVSVEHAYAGVTAVLDRVLWLVAALGAVAIAASLVAQRQAATVARRPR